MAQSALTVTPPNPTPPTNFSFVGATPPTDPAQAQVDDGTAGSLVVFAAKLAAAGAGTSVDAEGKGTETVVTSTVPNPSPAGQMVSFSDLGNYTTVPNQQHASSLSPAVNPTLTSITPGSTVSGVGNTTLAATGVGFTKQSVVYVNGVAQTTVFVSSTSLTCAAVAKKATAGAWAVVVVTGGVVQTLPQTCTFSYGGKMSDPKTTPIPEGPVSINEPPGSNVSPPPAPKPVPPEQHKDEHKDKRHNDEDHSRRRR